MFDLATIASAIPTAFSAAKEAVGLAKNIRDLTSDAETKVAMSDLLSRLIDTQGHILNAQQQVQEAVKYACELERQLSAIRTWESEAATYELYQPYQGTFVYAKKASELKGEPMHYLCPLCFQARKKSILQYGSPGAHFQRCLECEDVYYFNAPPIGIQAVPRQRRDFGL